MAAAAVGLAGPWAVDVDPAEAARGKKCPAGQVADGKHCVGDHACPDGMVPIPGLTFTMGDAKAKDHRAPARKVTVSPFCIDKTEVTTTAWRACEASGACPRIERDTLCNVDDDAYADHPINCVTWEGADAFCRSVGKRLPTEAEWEAAARGTDGRRWPWGNARPTIRHAHWTTGGKWRTRTAKVGSYPRGASPFGVLDMAGNVCELVADHYGPYPDRDEVDPSGPDSGAYRICRGGSLNNRDGDALSATFRRMGYRPGSTDELTGVRCAADKR